MRILSVHKFRQADGNLRKLGASRSILLLYDEFMQRGHEIDFLFLDHVLPKHTRRAHLVFPIAIFPRICALQRRKAYDMVEISGSDGWFYGLYHKRQRASNSPALLARSVGLEHLYWKALLQEERHEHANIPRRAKITYPVLTLRAVELTIKQADHFVCLCNQDRDYVVSQKWLPREGVSVIPPGVPGRWFSLTDNAHNTRERDLLFVGSWTPRKGVSYLVEAFTFILRQRPDTRLTLAGVHQSNPISILDQFPPEARSQVEIMPALSEEQLVQQYSSHKVMLFPSVYEGFGMVGLEAMACGLPVITTRLGGMMDVIEDGATGVFIPTRDSQALAEATLALLADRRRREEIGGRARERARSWTWHSVAERHERLYQQILANR